MASFAKGAVPFYSQKWDLAKWKESGFDSFEDAQYWEKSSCGVLCLKMAVDTFLLSRGEPVSVPIVEYIKRGVEIGAYKDSVGWSHEGLARLVKVFGFSAVNRGRVSATELRETLKRGSLPTVSIKWAFEVDKSLKEKLLFWKKLGGHLALVVGYGEEFGQKGFYVHHTSILEDYNWPNRFVSEQVFIQAFTGRCVVVGSKVQ